MKEEKIIEEDVIDLKELFQQIMKHIKMIILVTLIGALLVGVYTVFMVDKKYASTTRIYSKPEVTEGTFNQSEISANNMMVNNYIEMIKGNNIQSMIADELGVDKKEVSGALSVTNSSDTQIISITATTTDPELSKELAEKTVEVFRKEVKDNLNVTNIIIVDAAELNESPVSPSLTKNIAIGAMLGLVISLGYVFLRFMLDTRIHNKEEAEKYLGIPMLGSVPYLED